MLESKTTAQRRIVETDNWDSDYPFEVFVNVPRLNFADAKAICKILNESLQGNRYWKVVELDYELNNKGPD